MRTGWLVWVWNLAWDVVLCSWTRQVTLKVYSVSLRLLGGWNLMLGVALRWTDIPSTVAGEKHSPGGSLGLLQTQPLFCKSYQNFIIKTQTDFLLLLKKCKFTVVDCKSMHLIHGSLTFVDPCSILFNISLAIYFSLHQPLSQCTSHMPVNHTHYTPLARVAK